MGNFVDDFRVLSSWVTLAYSVGDFKNYLIKTIPYILFYTNYLILIKNGGILPPFWVVQLAFFARVMVILIVITIPWD